MRTRRGKLKVLFFQLPHYSRVMKNFEKYVQNLPMAAAMLKAMAMKSGLQKEADIEILNKTDNSFSSDARLMKLIRDRAPDLLCMSLYSWNAERSLYIAAETKKMLPGCRVIAGGPEVTADYSPYIFEGDTVDMGVEGEGEIAFLNILRHFAGGNGSYDHIEGILYKRDGKLVANPQAQRIEDVNDIPSPYLTGIIDPSDYFTIWLETMRWCPLKCSYCAHHDRFSGKASKAFSSVDRIREELKLAKQKNIESVGFLDSCINMSPHFKEICQVLKEIDPDRKMVAGAQILADRITEETARLLAESNFKFLEVGLQSSDLTVLENIRRRGELSKWLRGVRLLLATRADVYMDIIIGLPGQTVDTLRRSVQFLVENRLNTMAAVNLLSVFPSSQLRREKEQWGIRTQERPPYRTLETATLSFEEMKEEYRRCGSILGKGDDPGFDYPVMVTHATGKLPFKGEGWPETGEIDKKTLYSRPVTRILIDLAGRKMAETQWRRHAAELAAALAHTTLVWFKNVEPDTDAAFMGQCLADLSSSNPRGVWNVVIETGEPVSEKFIDTLQSAIHYLPNVIDYDHYYMLENLEKDYFRISDQFFILHPYSNKMSQKAEIYNSATRKTLWKVSLSSLEDIEGIGNALRDERVKSVVLDISMKAGGNLVFNALNTCKAKNVQLKPIWSTNWVIQYAWESMNIAANQQVTILGADEHILHLGASGNVLETVFDRDRLYAEVKRLFFLMRPEEEGPEQK